MRDEKAECLDHGIPLLHIIIPIPVHILREQPALPFELIDVGEDIRDVLPGDAPVPVLFKEELSRFLPRLSLIDHADRVVSRVVRNVDAAAVHVKHDVISVQFVLMDHGICPLTPYNS